MGTESRTDQEAEGVALSLRCPATGKIGEMAFIEFAKGLAWAGNPNNQYTIYATAFFTCPVCGEAHQIKFPSN